MAYSCYQANKDPKTGLFKPTEYKSSIQPYQMKVFDPKNYTDPMKIPIRKYELKEYKPTVYKPPPYKPFVPMQPYQLPDIDPLTGRPRRPRKIIRDGREEIIEDKPKDEPQPSTSQTPVPSFPPELGSTVGSVRRTLKFHEPPFGDY